MRRRSPPPPSTISERKELKIRWTRRSLRSVGSRNASKLRLRLAILYAPRGVIARASIPGRPGPLQAGSSCVRRRRACLGFARGEQLFERFESRCRRAEELDPHPGLFVMARRREHPARPRDPPRGLERGAVGEGDFEQNPATRRQGLRGADEDAATRDVAAPLPRQTKEWAARVRVGLRVDGRDPHREGQCKAVIPTAIDAPLGTRHGDTPHGRHRLGEDQLESCHAHAGSRLKPKRGHVEETLGTAARDRTPHEEAWANCRCVKSRSRSSSSVSGCASNSASLRTSPCASSTWGFARFCSNAAAAPRPRPCRGTTSLCSRRTCERSPWPISSGLCTARESRAFSISPAETTPKASICTAARSCSRVPTSASIGWGSAC